MDALQTGIVVADGERLILRPAPVLFRRRQLILFTLLAIAAAVLLALVFAYVFHPYVTWTRAAPGAVLVTLLFARSFTTQVTYVALRSADGIYLETKNRVLRTRRRRLLHAYADIDAVRLRSRVNPNAAVPGASPTGAYVHYDVLLEKRGGSSLLWYTRYPESAVQIAGAIAAFADVPVMNPENV